MAYFFHPGALLAIASGIALVLLGVGVLALRNRGVAGVLFSAVGVVWGFTIVAGNVSRMAVDAGTARPWFMAFLALQNVMYLPVLLLALAYPSRPKSVGRQPALWGLAALPAAAALVLLAVRPELFVEGLNSDPAGFVTVEQGPLFQPFGLLSSFLIFAGALAVSAVRLERSAPDLARKQSLLVVVALLPYVAYRASDLIAVGVIRADAFAVALGPTNFALRVSAAAACAMAVLLAMRAIAGTNSRAWQRIAAWLAVTPFIAGILEAYLKSTGVFGYDTVGLWRLVTVALFAFAIARYRLFDLDVKVKWTLKQSTVGAIFVAVFFIVSETAATFLSDRVGPYLGIAAAGLLVFAIAPLERFAGRVAESAMPNVKAAGDMSSAEKRRAYEEMVAAAWLDGSLGTAERRVLRNVRQRMGISADEAEAIEMAVMDAA